VPESRTPSSSPMSGSGAMVWDWDRFQDGIPVGYDAVYYQRHGRWSETASSHHAGPPAPVSGADLAPD
jgi:hypothetical protein